MKILVTGGAGYIGSITTELLLKAQHQVTVLDDLSTGFREAVSKDAEFAQADVRDADAVTQIMKHGSFDAVIHFAAKLIVPESILKPKEYHATNVGGGTNMIKACLEAGCTKMIFSSTAAVYGNAQGIIKESDAAKPINPYGETKLKVEHLLQQTHAERGEAFRFVTLRYFNVAGATPYLTNGQRTKNATHLIKVAAEAAVGKRDRISVYGTDYPTPDGTCVRDYIHVVDLAQAHLDALTYLNNGGPSDVFNCGYGQGSSVKEVLKTMQKVSGSSFKIEEAARRDGDPAALVADNAKIKKVLKWKPMHADLQEICKTAYEWEQKL